MPSIFLHFFVKTWKISKMIDIFQAKQRKFVGILWITTQKLPGWNSPSSKLPILAILTQPCPGYCDEIRHAQQKIWYAKSEMRATIYSTWLTLKLSCWAKIAFSPERSRRGSIWPQNMVLPCCECEIPALADLRLRGVYPWTKRRTQNDNLHMLFSKLCLCKNQSSWGYTRCESLSHNPAFSFVS